MTTNGLTTENYVCILPLHPFLPPLSIKFSAVSAISAVAAITASDTDVAAAAAAAAAPGYS